MWKPGQLVVLNGKVYRIKKRVIKWNVFCDTCTVCTAINGHYPCMRYPCTFVPHDCRKKMGLTCFPVYQYYINKGIKIQCRDKSAHK